MGIAFIFVAVLLLYFMLALALALGDYPLSIITSMGILCLGVYIAGHNIEGINNIMVQAFAMVCMGIGAYVFIGGSIEQFAETN